MSRRVVLARVLLVAASQAWSSELTSDRVVLAQRYFQAVWGGDPSALDELASPDIVISYPLFADLLGTPAIQGRESAKAFVTRFSQRWTNPKVEFHESVSDGDRVVLVWSFAAVSATSGEPDAAGAAEEHAWGGITLIRFDGQGQVNAEIGEESTPGPMGRLREIGRE